MIFSKPVYSEGDSLLVPEQVPIRQREIDFLNDCNIIYVLTAGTLVNNKDKPSDTKPSKSEKSPSSAKKVPKKFSSCLSVTIFRKMMVLSRQYF